MLCTMCQNVSCIMINISYRLDIENLKVCLKINLKYLQVTVYRSCFYAKTFQFKWSSLCKENKILASHENYGIMTTS